MNVIKRAGEEILSISNCPCCGLEVTVHDCGYSSFNPGWVICANCSRHWKLGYVDNRWEAVKLWNNTVSVIKRKLLVFNKLKDRLAFPVSVTRDFFEEELEAEAKIMMDSFYEFIIESKPLKDK
jgi:transcription elongation factor Elf1